MTTTPSPSTGAAARSTSSSPKTKRWWATPRAKLSGRIALAISVVSVIVWWFFFHPYVSTDDARVAMTLVRVAPNGAGGQIIKVNVEEGDPVKKGQVLVELDHRTAEANVATAQARAKLAQDDLKRASLLMSQHNLPYRDFDRAQSDAQTSQAQLQLAQVALENTYLKSPFDGQVVQKLAEVGNILEPGQVAVTVADVGGAWVAANVEETSIGDVKLNQPVKISVDEGGNLTGKVSEITAAAASQFALIPAESAAGNYTKLVQRIPIKVKLDPHPGQTLRAGQSVEIKIRVR